ncbi:MAG: hypothetical protein IT384_13820 [Deltaproteobacteria bacterium]|nr:hypothetical protein [Deltaproteobacteria bacterium]
MKVAPARAPTRGRVGTRPRGAVHLRASFASLLLVACSGPAPVAVLVSGLPDDVVWIGFRGGVDGLPPGTPLGPREQGRFLLRPGVIDEGAAVEVVGFREQTVRFARDIDPDLFARAPVHAPGLSSEGAIVSDWAGSGVWSGEETVIHPAPIPLSVSADWIKCPAIATTSAAYVHDGCTKTTCATRIRQAQCHVEIDFGGCSTHQQRGAFNASGGLALESTDFGRCAPVQPPMGVESSAECESAEGLRCRLDVLTQAAPLIRVVTATIVSGPETPPRMPPYRTGYLGGLAVLRDRIVVSTFNGAAGPVECAQGAGALAFVDPETMTISTSTAPPCTTLLAADPTSAGFVGLGGTDGQTMIRFDGAGRVVHQALLPVPSSWVPWALERAGSTDRYGMVYGPPDRSRGVPQRAYVVDESFTVLQTVELAPRGALAWAAEGLVLVGGDWVVTYDASTNGLGAPVAIRYGVCGQSDVAFAAARGAVRALASRHYSESVLLWTSRGCVGATFFEWRAVPGALVFWPASPHLLLVAYDSRELDGLSTGPSALALVDVESAVVLPGALPVGEAPVEPLRADSTGRVWGMQSARGRILRIEPL